MSGFTLLLTGPRNEAPRAIRLTSSLRMDGLTALFGAVAAGDVEGTRVLLRRSDAHTYIDAYDADGATPTYVAAALGHTAVVELLADEGRADIARATRADATALLVREWQDVPPPPARLGQEDGGASPLYIAARNGWADTVRALIQRGVDVNQTKANGTSALVGAAGDGRLEATKVLLAHGGKVDLASSNGTTPVYVASFQGFDAVVQALLAAGAAVNHRVQNGATPILIASHAGHTSTVGVLVAAGGDATLSANNGTSPVYVAAYAGYLETIKVLVANGGCVNQVRKRSEAGGGAAGVD